MEQNDFPTSVGFECDTVGCVIIDNKGRLASGSRPVVWAMNMLQSLRLLSPSATDASRYAITTSKGEQINNDAVASKTETRIRDGMSLADVY